MKYDNSRCLVLGAQGFIGQNLCRSLIASGRPVRAFGRRLNHFKYGVPCEEVEGDFSDPNLHDQLLDGCSSVVHLIGGSVPAQSNKNVATDLQTNVLPTLHFLEACRRNSVKKIVFASSGGTIYGRTNIVPTPETAPLEPITAYGISKLAIERYLHLYHYLHGIDFVSLRIANPYGPFQDAGKGQGIIAAIMRRAVAGEPVEIWGDGSVIRDYLFVDDLVSAISAALNYSGSQHFLNIGSGEGTSINQLISTIEGVLGTQIYKIYKDSRATDVPTSILDISTARQELLWRPETSLQQGIERTLDWVNQNRTTA